jgi:hypothetical protein
VEEVYHAATDGKHKETLHPLLAHVTLLLLLLLLLRLFYFQLLERTALPYSTVLVSPFKSLSVAHSHLPVVSRFTSIALAHLPVPVSLFKSLL